jgi:hypothetical protein
MPVRYADHAARRSGTRIPKTKPHRIDASRYRTINFTIRACCRYVIDNALKDRYHQVDAIGNLNLDVPACSQENIHSMCLVNDCGRVFVTFIQQNINSSSSSVRPAKSSSPESKSYFKVISILILFKHMSNSLLKSACCIWHESVIL